jgi:peptidoglycan hydrolase-like protein with peptidoglycan-binding domain
MTKAGKRGTVIAALVVAAALGATAAVLAVGGQPTPDARRSGPPITTPVVREDLIDAVTIPGEVGHGAATPIVSRAAGTLTWLPAVDTVVNRGGALFRADERPVVLLIGLVPMYRALSAGVSGPDVRQLEDNLRALGYGGFTADNQFGAATTSAVRQWQKDLGVPVTGVVDIADIIYSPTAVRVEAPLARLGASATGEVLSVTGVTKVVHANMPQASAGWAKPGTTVVILAGSAKTDGRVEQAVTDPSNGTVTVLVSVADQASLTDATVQVQYVARQRPGVLTVPVTALLALDNGGYGVELADGLIVPVQVGMFAAGKVEISGAGISEGVRVGIPQ